MRKHWIRFWEVVTNWELWPFELRYALISPVWVWYCLRSRSAWYFTPSNPTLTFGGFEGEPKHEMYAQLPTHLYPKTIYVKPGEPFEPMQERLLVNGITYPLCAKPDIGMKGLLFRKLDTEAQLQTYHKLNPVPYMVQELAQYPMEVSVFYYRYPNQQKGVITGFIQKKLMEVAGDGKRTVLQLIQAHPEARHRERELQVKHGAHLEVILPAGEPYPLAFAANLNRGARFISLEHLIDEQLLAVFDALSHPAQFYYGRYDIKCQSVEALKQGRDFTILEFNGSGAEPNHVYHTGCGLFAALRVFLMHWKVLYEISRYNAAHGVPYWSFSRGWKFTMQFRRYLRLLERYESIIPM